jgi:hypothetical protein
MEKQKTIVSIAYIQIVLHAIVLILLMIISATSVGHDVQNHNSAYLFIASILMMLSLFIIPPFFVILTKNPLAYKIAKIFLILGCIVAIINIFAIFNLVSAIAFYLK